MKDKLAFVLLRVTLGVVFLIFGLGKFTNDYWAQTMAEMPVVRAMPWPAAWSVLAFGVLEVLTALCLIAGLWVRVAGLLAASQLLAILIVFQFQEVRDIGLLGAALFLMFASPGIKKG